MERLIIRSNLPAREGSRRAIISPREEVIQRNSRRAHMYVHVLQCSSNVSF